MATKHSKSVGSTQLFYIQQAAKMCPYPVSIEEGLIYIPQDELETDDLSVAHLCTLGFKIQSCIPGAVEKKSPYNPDLLLTSRVIERAKSEFLPGDAFITESSCETLRITHIERGKIHLAYDAPVDTRLRQKAPLLVSEEQFKKVLNRGIWQRV